MRSPSRWFALAAAGLVLAAVAVVAFGGEPKRLDPSSPEGVVQGFVTAVLDGDLATAREMLVADPSTVVDGLCPRPADVTDISRVAIADTTVSGDEATVWVTITTGGGNDPFDSGYTGRDSFHLVNQDGAWRIDQTPWQLCVGE